MYLIGLSSQLAARGHEESSKELAAASRFACGMTTEFLGESRDALTRVEQLARAALDEAAVAYLRAVLDQLDAALNRK